MKNKIIVLVLSIVVAIIVLCIGAFGIGEISSHNAKKKEMNNVEKDSTGKVVGEDNSDTSEKDTSKGEETTSKENQTSQEQTTTEEETTEEPQTFNEADKYKDSNIDPTKLMVALTFDDGPKCENTTRILDALKQYDAHATFFVVGYNIDGNEELLKRAVNEGSEIGNHTKGHAKLTALDSNGILDEVDSVKNRIKEITGEERVLLRPPYGAVDDNVMAAITDPVILWSIDTLDWKTKDPNCTLQNIQCSVYDGAIILMHDIYSQSADAAVAVIDWLHSQGYQMVTVSEMGYFRRGGLKTGIRYGSLKPN